MRTEYGTILFKPRSHEEKIPEPLETFENGSLSTPEDNIDVNGLVYEHIKNNPNFNNRGVLSAISP